PPTPTPRAAAPLPYTTLFRSPSVVHWTGGAGDNQWLTAGNWDSGQLPTASDDVVIDIVEDPTIVYAGGDATINSLKSAENVQLTDRKSTRLNPVTRSSRMPSS